MQGFKHPGVEEVFAKYPERVRSRLLVLRDLIFETAASIEGVGELEETLRWGEPSYLTTQSGSGSMIRINRLDPRRGGYAMYFLCQTDLVPAFRKLYPKSLIFDGNRAIVFNEHDPIPVDDLRHCIALALTYKKVKPSRKAARAKGSAE